MSRINTLHPLIREEVRQAVDHVNTHILTSGVKMLVTQGLRTFEEQRQKRTVHSQLRTCFRLLPISRRKTSMGRDERL